MCVVACHVFFSSYFQPFIYQKYVGRIVENEKYYLKVLKIVKTIFVLIFHKLYNSLKLKTCRKQPESRQHIILPIMPRKITITPLLATHHIFSLHLFKMFQNLKTSQNYNIHNNFILEGVYTLHVVWKVYGEQYSG